MGARPISRRDNLRSQRRGRTPPKPPRRNSCATRVRVVTYSMTLTVQILGRAPCDGRVGGFWLDTYQVQIFPGTASMFLARQYMRGIRDEVLDAARADGAGHWTTFFRIVVPMSTPVLGAIAVLTFVYKWSDYLWPAVMVNSPQLQPVMVTLPALSTTASGFIVRYEILLAGALVITLPLILLSARFQKQLTTSSMVGAVRG